MYGDFNKLRVPGVQDVWSEIVVYEVENKISTDIPPILGYDDKIVKFRRHLISTEKCSILFFFYR